ncbi:hypothetical protein ACQP2T_27090 [Nonomuraea sp. CA-143628]|uniref:hypothetical protein n=1 Tax=Nonomuraea sp. CA-143628 TaxID=3239997 RepID=UPI003D8AB831
MTGPARVTLALLLAACLAVLSSSSTPRPPERPVEPLDVLGDGPKVCDVISRRAVERALGLRFFVVRRRPFDNDGDVTFACAVLSRPDSHVDLRIEAHDPSGLTLRRLRDLQASQDPLPEDALPGFSEETGAWTWTPNGGRLLTVYLPDGDPARDSAADAAEFARQLKPVLLLRSLRGRR